jgi:hypothetical protein
VGRNSDSVFRRGAATHRQCIPAQRNGNAGARLHKDSSPRGIASRAGADKVLPGPCPLLDPSFAIERKLMNNQDGLEHELDVLLAKAGANVPPHLKAGILAGYRDMKVMAATVRQPRTAAAEPSNVFSLTSYARNA